MQYVRLPEPEHVAVAGARCPECQHPMMLVRVLPALDHEPSLAGFYCKPCHFASTVVLKD
jgi:hypothetical protein